MSVETKEMNGGNTPEASDRSSPASDSPQAGEIDNGPTEAATSDPALAECADHASEAVATGAPDGDGHGRSWTRVLAFGLLPGLALIFAIAAGFSKWQDSSVRATEDTRLESVQAAKDSTVALLSYRPDTVEKDLAAARDRLTGSFRDSYSSLTHDLVIPGAKQKQISAVVSVPAVASVSASADHAVVLVFVNQTIVVGSDAPTATASSVKVSLDKIGGRWLISDFTPV